jgi:tetratricopeptide (TPR) repeat protein
MTPRIIPFRFKAVGAQFYWLLPALLSAVACLLLYGLRLSLSPDWLDAGENLLHPGLAGAYGNWYMPLGPLWAALLAFPVFSFHLAALSKCALLFLVVGGSFSLAEFLFSPLAGLLAGITAVFLCLAPGCDTEQLVYSGMLLLLANVLARNFSAGARKDAAVGFAVGATLLVKSVLAPFPLFYLFATCRGQRIGLLARRAALLFCGTLLAALLWGGANYAENRSFVLLDSPRGNANFVTGLLGLTGTAEGDIRSLAGLEKSDSVALWAAHTIAAHPLRYLSGVAQRFWLLITLHPLLLILAAAGIWFRRRNQNMRLTVLLAAYFLTAHCLMSVEPRYFAPALFLCAAFAAGLADGVIIFAGERRTHAARFIFCVSVCICAAAALAAFWLVLRHPFVRKADAVDFASAARREPENAWVLERAAAFSLGVGDLGGACTLMKPLYALSPAVPGRYISILLSCGGEPPGDIAAQRLRGMGGNALLWLMLADLAAGRYGDASAAFAGYEKNNEYVRSPSGEYETRMLEMMHSRVREHTEAVLGDMLVSLPYERMALLAARLPRVGLDPEKILAGKFCGFPDIAMQSCGKGMTALPDDPARARVLLERCLELNPHYLPAYPQLGGIYEHNGERQKALELYKKAEDANALLPFEQPLLEAIRARHKKLQSAR